MAHQQAHTLQQHALDTLGELRSWLLVREAELTATALLATPSPAESRAAYAAWNAQVDAVLRAVGRAFPECEKEDDAAPGSDEPAAESAPPTLPSHGTGHLRSGA